MKCDSLRRHTERLLKVYKNELIEELEKVCDHETTMLIPIYEVVRIIKLHHKQFTEE